MTTILRHTHILFFAFSLYALTGCAEFGNSCLTSIRSLEEMNPQTASIRKYQEDQRIYNERQSILKAFLANPDTDAWQTQRQQIVQAVGDRDYNVNFSRAFDSLVVTVSSLEFPVKNMERQSGYISTEGLSLPPSEEKAMRKEMIMQWARENNYDPSCFEDSYQPTNSFAAMFDVSENMLSAQRTSKTITFQLVKLGDDRTRVKARFSNVFFPTEIQTLYERVWQTMDKQIFMDKNIDGETVDKRE